MKTPEISDPDYDKINRTLGVDLFRDDNLWDDGDRVVANALGLRLEGRTTRDASFRSTYRGDDEMVLGLKAYSILLYSVSEKASYISIVFINKGDFPAFASQYISGHEKRVMPDEDMRDAGSFFRDEIKREVKIVRERMTSLFGKAKKIKFGRGLMQEWVYRWNWRDHSIILSYKDNDYVGLRIMPVEMADTRGRVAGRQKDSDFRAELSGRVVHRKNGDVILSDIPMVDQGPKGYCVPATWERYLRYVGISSDMYILAMAAQSAPGGGTSPALMIDAVSSLVSRTGRRIKSFPPRWKISFFTKYIEEGFPLMWIMNVESDLNRNLTSRSVLRKKCRDSAEWRDFLEEPRKAVDRIDLSTAEHHMCMITGYNSLTDEIAISDSWGAEFAERWITLEEAEAIDGGMLYIIKW